MHYSDLGHLRNFDMGRNNYFQFKQFLVRQEKAAMKVGTDGVLLGAWVNVQNEQKILDIGTGTGVIALMLAQRTFAQITGIEIEQNAAEEATQNCSNSPWAERIKIKHSAFQEFVKKTDTKFDLIVSNPPFFSNDKRSQDNNISIAKHSDLLPLNELLFGAEKLLENSGKLALILPVIQAKKQIGKAKNIGLHLSRLTKIKPSPEKATIRYLMEFNKQNEKPKTDYLTIFEKNGKQFSDQYRELTKDFYLSF